MTHLTTDQHFDVNTMVYSTYSNFAAASMNTLMAKRSWRQLQERDTLEEICAKAHEYALEMMALQDAETLETLRKIQ